MPPEDVNKVQQMWTKSRSLPKGSTSQGKTSINVLSSLTGTVQTAFTADESSVVDFAI